MQRAGLSDYRGMRELKTTGHGTVVRIRADVCAVHKFDNQVVMSVDNVSRHDEHSAHCMLHHPGQAGRS